MKQDLNTKYKVAVCQMDSQDDKEKNLISAKEMIRAASAQGASLVVFPENMNYMGKGYRYQAEPIPGPTTDFLADLAKGYGIWIVSGSIPEAVPGTDEKKPKPKNTLALIDPDGNIRCKFSKLHMFDVDLEDGKSFRESDTATAGNEIVLCDTPLGKLGFTICYDLRFGELYRLLALSGAQVIFVPASFTAQTGAAHWEALLRARAIENGVYIVACNQIGEKSNMTAYGQSMVIDPWGTVIARAEDKPGALMAEIDLSDPEKIRGQIPALKNRRTDVYDLIANAGIESHDARPGCT